MYQTTNYFFSCISAILSIFSIIYSLILSYKYKKTIYRILALFSVMFLSYVVYCSFQASKENSNISYLALSSLFLTVFWLIVLYVFKNDNKYYVNMHDLNHIFFSSRTEEEYINKKIHHLSKLKINTSIPHSKNRISDFYNIPQNFPIIIVGFKESGKTSIGSILSAKLGRTFIDTDNVIKSEISPSYSSLRQYIRINGHEKYLELEANCLSSTLMSIKKNSIVALGGGTADNKEIMNKIKNYGTIVYLDVSRTELFNKIKDKKSHPLFIDPNNIVNSFDNAFNRRSVIYKEKADICVKLKSLNKVEKNACEVLSALEMYFKNKNSNN